VTLSSCSGQCFLYLWCKAESGGYSGDIGSRHAAADLLTELFDVGAGGVQVLQKDGEAGALLTRRHEGPQTGDLHAHAVQDILGELGGERMERFSGILSFLLYFCS